MSEISRTGQIKWYGVRPAEADLRSRFAGNKHLNLSRGSEQDLTAGTKKSSWIWQKQLDNTRAYGTEKISWNWTWKSGTLKSSRNRLLNSWANQNNWNTKDQMILNKAAEQELSNWNTKDHLILAKAAEQIWAAGTKMISWTWQKLMNWKKRRSAGPE